MQGRSVCNLPLELLRIDVLVIQEVHHLMEAQGVHVEALRLARQEYGLLFLTLGSGTMLALSQTCLPLITELVATSLDLLYLRRMALWRHFAANAGVPKNTTRRNLRALLHMGRTSRVRHRLVSMNQRLDILRRLITRRTPTRKVVF